MTIKNITIIGGGPSGLIAAEILAKAGCEVSIYDSMPSLGRKFLMAGRGGLNLTHSEPLEKFLTRYGDAEAWLTPYIKAFTPTDLRAWCEGLGQETFIGSSGRIFPKAMKGAPLLRAWLKRLGELGVKYHPQHTWLGFDGDAALFKNTKGQIKIKADAALLALGGASWPRLGSDGSWAKILADIGVEISPLRPANCGFTVGWSDYFQDRFAGQPLKPVALSYNKTSQQGELMITKKGIEGGVVYALSSTLREAVEAKGSAKLLLDLRPDMTHEGLAKKLGARGSNSFSNYLRKAGFSQVSAALLREAFTQDELSKATPDALAKILKALPLTLTATSGIARAISTAGGIKQDAVTKDLMLKAKPGIFVAGEMLDWEAPTGGYLLQACFSLGIAAAKGIIA